MLTCFASPLLPRPPTHRPSNCAEFADIPTAVAVHEAQQGAILASSDRGGIRIQYSKNPFGRKRDAAGAFVAVVDAAGGGFGGAAPGAVPTTQAMDLGGAFAGAPPAS